jgi:hypothetical protein
MSVQELKLSGSLTTLRANRDRFVYIHIDNTQGQSLLAVLDRNQADLLRLWLEEYCGQITAAKLANGYCNKP